MMNDYLENERLLLRAVEPGDLDFIYQIENLPSMWEVSSFTVPYSRYVVAQYIEHTTSDIFADKQLRLMIELKPGGEVIGTIDIADFVPLHGRGAVGIAVHKDYCGKGYATDALQLLCDYAFGFLGMKQLYAFIPADNTPSLNLFSKCDFVKSGVLKDWLRSGEEYKDAVFVQKIR